MLSPNIVLCTHEQWTKATHTAVLWERNAIQSNKLPIQVDFLLSSRCKLFWQNWQSERQQRVCSVRSLQFYEMWFRWKNLWLHPAFSRSCLKEWAKPRVYVCRFHSHQNLPSFLENVPPAKEQYATVGNIYSKFTPRLIRTVTHLSRIFPSGSFMFVWNVNVMGYCTGLSSETF